jgi:CelD/BcsL family acetyltransferase involved in cellulose biosynthesis
MADVERSRAAGLLRAERIEDWDTIAGDWAELAKTCGNVFGTPEWVTTWWEHFGGGRPRLLVGLRDSLGRLVAFAPLYLWRERPLRIARVIGHGPSDEAAVLIAPERRPDALGSLTDVLASQRYDAFIGEQLPRRDGWGTLPAATRLREEASPVLDIAGRSWEEFLAGRSTNFRQWLRRRERRLAAASTSVRFRTCDASSETADFDLLLRLHRLRWPSGSGFSRAASFHRRFALLARERGWARIVFLEVDGEACAAWYGFRFAGADCFYQGGRDPRWEPFGVGSILLAETVHQAFREGQSEYRFLRGDEHYKSRFATRDDGLETVALASRRIGRAAVAAVAALPGRLQRRLAG